MSTELKKGKKEKVILTEWSYLGKHIVEAICLQKWKFSTTKTKKAEKV